MKTKEIKFNYSKIYVTGANGWLGRQLIETLYNGDSEVLENFTPTNYQIKALLLKNDDRSFLNEFKDLDIFEGNISLKSDCYNFFNNNLNDNSILIHTCYI